MPLRERDKASKEMYRNCSRRTYHRLLSFFVQLHGTQAVSNEKRKMEQVLNRLSKIVRVDNEVEQINGLLVNQKFGDLRSC